MKRRNPFRSEPPHKGHKRESPAYLQHTGRKWQGFTAPPPKKHTLTSNYPIQCYIKFLILGPEMTENWMAICGTRLLKLSVYSQVTQAQNMITIGTVE